jgi:aryl-alcohol dehydrogenase-like predicted oxidoreductase
MQAMIERNQAFRALRPTRRAAVQWTLGLAAGLRPVVAAAVAPEILTRPILRSNEPLPVVGLGTAVNFDIGDNTEKRAALAAVLRTLAAGGGRLVDTASSYGTAESVLGQLFAETGMRQRLFVASKVEARELADPPAALDRALRRLRSERLELMMLHNVSRPEESLAPMRQWQSAGTVRYLGISTSSAPDFEAVETVMRREKPDFLEVNYSLGDREAEKRLLPAAAELGIAVLADLPFARGRLFRAVKGRTLPEWASEFDAASWAQFFLKYLIGHPAVTAVIPGTAEPEHMQDNLGAGHGRLPDAAQRGRMVQFLESLG